MKKNSNRNVIHAEYDWINSANYETHFQLVWDAIRHGDIIDVDSLNSKHLKNYVERCFDFFTSINQITIFFQSSKGRLNKIKRFAASQKLRYKTLGKKKETKIRMCKVEM